MSTDRTHQLIQLLSKAAKTGEEVVFEDGVGGRFRVTAERIEPGKKWWRLYWHWSHTMPGNTGITEVNSGDSTVVVYKPSGELQAVDFFMHSATEPTLAEFAASVKDATGVEIPMPEEEKPQWWQWDSGRWRPTESRHTAYTETFLRVYATTADRDAKAAVLIDAARKAGQP